MNNIIYYIYFLYFLTISVWFFFACFEQIKLYKLRKLQYVLTFVRRDAFFSSSFFFWQMHLIAKKFATPYPRNLNYPSLICSKIRSHNIHQRKLNTEYTSGFQILIVSEPELFLFIPKKHVCQNGNDTYKYVLYTQPDHGQLLTFIGNHKSQVGNSIIPYTSTFCLSNMSELFVTQKPGKIFTKYMCME